MVFISESGNLYQPSVSFSGGKDGGRGGADMQGLVDRRTPLPRHLYVMPLDPYPYLPIYLIVHESNARRWIGTLYRKLRYLPTLVVSKTAAYLCDSMGVSKFRSTGLLLFSVTMLMTS